MTNPIGALKTLDTDLKPGVKITDCITKSDVGKWFEKQIKKYPIFKHNPGPGVDIPDFLLELKTRDVNSTSGQTVTKMTRNKLLSYEWNDKNPAWQKLQYQYRMHYDFETLEILEVELWDFTIDRIQNRFAKEWLAIKTLLLKDPKLVRTTTKDMWLYLDKEQKSNTYHVRINDSTLRQLAAEIESHRLDSAYRHNFIEDDNADFVVQNVAVSKKLASNIDILDCFTNMPVMTTTKPKKISQKTNKTGSLFDRFF